ncbi:transcriptional regulator, DeoR family [Clostridium acidisoli DSM 12555]|uniref:Transcriptional regulator, DeoR family n=1 Tax=Clostridium acidisoli DSM 12555 TaxID=1121291 RepID=A0A1W1WZ73_9CLOT|nr:DeoR/GlpR family DNA-binding transcription regulator [Clostridium acidisoli]SMC17036.1 transcriptional regulator, DeoR family [Clostridium acidisoli DSM 12555]
MFAEERLQEILNILKAKGKVKVKELSVKFDVTEDCIRKDLKVLESQGNLKRTYGGAVQIRESSNAYDMQERSEIDVSNKTIIAEKAFNIITDRETIFLDISTTNILLAKLLAESNKRVTVVTNMLEILNILSKQNNISVVATGGILNKNLNGFTGAPTIDLISRYKFDKCFIGSCGVDVFDRTITTFDIDDGITKSSIISSSKKTFLVMESKKFHLDGNYKFAKIDDIDSIISDKLPDKEITDVIKEFNISII